MLMHKKFSKLIVIILVSSAFSSCIQKQKGNISPDLNWELVWADEFEGNTININNWNFQVLEACLLYTSPSPRDRG